MIRLSHYFNRYTWIFFNPHLDAAKLSARSANFSPNTKFELSTEAHRGGGGGDSVPEEEGSAWIFFGSVSHSSAGFTSGAGAEAVGGGVVSSLTRLAEPAESSSDLSGVRLPGLEGHGIGGKLVAEKSLASFFDIFLGCVSQFDWLSFSSSINCHSAFGKKSALSHLPRRINLYKN
jgi:hypothetical protein